MRALLSTIPVKAVCAALLLWLSAGASGAIYTPVDLHPTGYTSSQIRAVSDDGAQQAGFARINGSARAMTWSGSVSSALDLHPPGYAFSSLLGTNGVQQVGSNGWTGGNLPPDAEALLWSGSSGSAVSLHPAGVSNSVATAIHGGTQVGYGLTGTGSSEHALLWSGTAASVVDLNPPGYFHSVAHAVHGSVQGGSGFVTGIRHLHALLWSGTAESAQSLQPAGYAQSEILGLSAAQQVGYARLPDSGAIGARHAFVWSGSAASAVDLHPGPTFSFSTAYDTNGQQQVGYGHLAAAGAGVQGQRALVWFGTAASAVNLHDLLPPEYVGSIAYAIDDPGNVYGFAHHGPTAADHAMMWVVPEPGSALFVAVVAASALLRRSRGQPL